MSKRWFQYLVHWKGKLYSVLYIMFVYDDSFNSLTKTHWPIMNVPRFRKYYFRFFFPFGYGYFPGTRFPSIQRLRFNASDKRPRHQFGPRQRVNSNPLVAVAAVTDGNGRLPRADNAVRNCDHFKLWMCVRFSYMHFFIQWMGSMMVCFFIFILIERKKIVTEWRWCGGYFSWLSKRIQLRWYANNARNVSDRIGTFVDDAHEWFCFGIIRLWGIDIFFMYEFIVRCCFKNKIGFVSEKWFRCNWDILFAAVAKLVEIKAVEILWFHVSLQVFLKT